MVSDFKNWLLKPYPFPITIKEKLFISFGFGVFVVFFLNLLTPFDFNLLDNQLFVSFIYGIITTTILIINLWLFPLIFKDFFNQNNWNIKKTILLVTEIMLVISILNTLFTKSLNNINTSYLQFITNTFLTGVFPMFVYIYINEYNINKKHKKIAENISLKKKSTKTNTDKFIIIGENKNEQFEVSLENLIYIKTEKNYSSIFYYQENVIKEQLLRISLNKIEKQLKSKYIVRCHKSYIVNAKKVDKIHGNARGYFLKIENIDFSIPVSRNFPKELLFTLIE